MGSYVGSEAAETFVVGEVGLASSVSGGGGNDTITTQNGPDTVDGGAGHDRITAGFDNDTVTGGPGRDAIFADSTIDTAANCETNEAAGGSGGAAGGGPGGGPGGAGTLTVLSARSIRQILRSGLRVRVSCPAACTIQARLIADKRLARVRDPPVGFRRVRAIDLRHMGLEKVICCWEVDGVLVDPGPQSTEETLLEALGGEKPRALLLTHIHFDHAGASGALVRRWPDLEVYVHERGAPHMADPEKLVSSAGRLYGGEEGLKRLWGEVVPVPEENLRVLSGGETLLDGEFRVEYTPGHASHHVCYLHEGSRWAFVGDMAGVAVPPDGFTLAPTPPPDIDVEAWERSLDAIAAWEPAGLGLTHFGAAEDAPAQLEAVREALRAQVALIEDAGDDQERFMAAIRERVESGAGEHAAAILQAAPPDHLFLGLRRWADKRG